MLSGAFKQAMVWGWISHNPVPLTTPPAVEQPDTRPPEVGQAERAYAELSADGAPVSAGQLAAAAGLSASYARALIAQFQAQPPAVLHHNGHRSASADAHPEAGP